MESEVVTDWVNRQPWTEPVADSLQTAIGSVYKAAGPPGQKVADVLHGVWLGHSLHPILTDVPLGAWTTAAALDLMEIGLGRKELAPGADAAVGLGLLGALGSAVTGFTDWYLLQDKGPKQTGAAHAVLNIGATLLYTTSWLLRKRGARKAGIAVSWLGYGVVSAAAYLGGALVSEQKVGVDHGTREGLPEDFVSVLALDALPEGKPTKAEANGVPIVLVRQGDKIQALGATCSHLGGPLDEGTLEDGCVVCPWHQSRFRLDDGKVVNGPATFPQPLFETRVRDGQIEVRAPKIPQNQA